jgi:hypothetical protein
MAPPATGAVIRDADDDDATSRHRLMIRVRSGRWPTQRLPTTARRPADLRAGRRGA